VFFPVKLSHERFIKFVITQTNSVAETWFVKPEECTMSKPTIFISYSHKDEEWKNRLVTHLGILQQQGYLDIWVDTRIESGADWFQEIK
jgi:hypothetical protein